MNGTAPQGHRRRTRIAAVAVVAFLPGLATAGDIPGSVDGSLITNYVRARPGVAGSGQPSEDGLRQLKRLGFRTVVNLRVPGENGYVDEKAVIEGQGLRYVHVPLTASTLSAADVAVNPVGFGSGSNIKMPVYLAAGLPIVTTPVGLRGFEELAAHAVVADPEGFVEAIPRALELSPAPRTRLEPLTWGALARRLAGAYAALDGSAE